MKNITGTVLFFIVAIMLIPSGASGDMKHFIPKIYSYTGNLEIDMRYESNEDKTNDQSTNNSSMVLREMINLSMNGFVYHPRFIVYLANISAGLQHDKFKSDFNSTSWTTSTADEYEFRVMALPEHPYNLELFSTRITPFVSGRVSQDIKPVSTSTGAIFRYKKRPFFFNTSYIVNNIDLGKSSSESKTYKATASYFIGPATNSATYSHQESARSFGIKTLRDNYYFENTLGFKNITLNSRVNLNKHKQESPSTGSLSADTFTWTEFLKIKLPWNFDSNLSYNLYKDTFQYRDTSTSDSSATAQLRDLSSTSESISMNITHRLYHSVMTGYVINLINTESFGGTIKTISNSFYSNYTKKIPTGRFSAGINLNRSVMDRKGASVINELHDLIDINPVTGGFFDLRQSGANISTIAVFLKNPDPPFERIRLQETEHYTLSPIGNTFRVTIKDTIRDLPPGFPVPEIYDFLVSYEVISGDFELQTTGVGYNIKLKLFNDFLNPYYVYFSSKQEVLSGSFIGQPHDTTSDTIGVILQKPPYTLLLEYQNLKSNIDPSKTWKTAVDYSKYITPTTNLYTKIHYSKISYPEGLGTDGISFSENKTGVDLRLQKAFTRKNINLSLGAAYLHQKGLSLTKTISLYSNLSWKTGKFFFEFATNASHSQNEIKTGKNELTYQSYYLKAKRELF